MQENHNEAVENHDILITKKETRHRLGDICNTGFYKLVKSGQLDIIKIGNKSCNSLNQVNQLIARLKAANYKPVRPEKLKRKVGRPRKGEERTAKQSAPVKPKQPSKNRSSAAIAA